MRRYARYDDDGSLLCIGTGAGGVEIDEEAYKRLRAVICEKAAYVGAMQSGQMAITDVPQAYRAEVDDIVQRRKAERTETEASAADYEAALARLGVEA